MPDLRQQFLKNIKKTVVAVPRDPIMTIISLISDCSCKTGDQLLEILSVQTLTQGHFGAVRKNKMRVAII